MSMIPWRNKLRQRGQDAGSSLANLRGEMDRLMETFVREPFSNMEWPFLGQGKWAPAVDVVENDKEVTVRAEMPGIDPKDLNVVVSGKQLIISGEKKESTEQSGKDFFHSEIRFGSFRRAIPLPDGVDSENVDAQFTNGVLTLRMNKQLGSKPKQIEIKTQS
jgi:HSP20 family protein